MFHVFDTHQMMVSHLTMVKKGESQGEGSSWKTHHMSGWGKNSARVALKFRRHLGWRGSEGQSLVALRLLCLPASLVPSAWEFLPPFMHGVCLNLPSLLLVEWSGWELQG